MNGKMKSFLKHSWKAIGGILLFFGIVISKGSDLATILAYLHIEPHGKAAATTQAQTAPTPQPQPVHVQPAHPTGKTAAQSSSGAQSPNLNGVQGNVDIHYGTSPKASASQPATTLPLKPKVNPNGGVVQSSSGAQSPNISNVGGDLKLNYDSQPAPAADHK
jgi:hypothetical protein